MNNNKNDEKKEKMRRQSTLIIICSALFSVCLIYTSRKIKTLLDTAVYVGPNKASELNALIICQEVLTLLLLAVAIITVLTAFRVYSAGKKTEDSLKYEVEHDKLTGLLNRAAFDRLREGERRSHQVLLLIDIDNFKEINDNYGHDVGDEVLKKVARIIDHAFRSTDFPCRIGGDEFAVIITNMLPEMKDVIVRKTGTIREALLETSDGLPVVTLSAGAAFTERDLTPAELFKRADNALYHVKKNGRDGFAFFEELDGSELMGSVEVTPIDKN